jgi:DNA-binding CsgD family transcriptional regulator
VRWERPLDLLEAAYRLDGTDGEWMRGLVEKMDETFSGDGLGAGGLFAAGRIDGGGRTVLADVQLRYVVDRGGDRGSDVLAAMRAYPARLPADIQERTFFSSVTASTASIVTGLGMTLNDNPIWRHSGLKFLGAKDALFLTCHDGPLGSVVLFDALRDLATLESRALHVWQRIATHVGAAFRLRRGRDATPERAAAVLSAGGRIRHLAPGTSGPAIADGFARRRHARKRGIPPESALEVWQGLHDCRWSLIDYIDTDDSAFVLAVRNEPAREVASTLTARQRAAVALAALGYGNKQIAYALGLTVTAVAMLLARARAATGLRTRAELVRGFKRSLARQAAGQ